MPAERLALSVAAQMETTRPLNPVKDSPFRSLQRCYLYSPDTIVAYCVLILPVGLYLYGLNVARRGSRIMGYFMVGLSAIALLGMLTGFALGIRVSTFGAIGIFVGIGLYKMECSRYRLELSRGAVNARWWPPLLWVLGLIVALVIILRIWTPEGIVS
jgi:hypothetical protein